MNGVDKVANDGQVRVLPVASSQPGKVAIVGIHSTLPRVGLAA